MMIAGVETGKISNSVLELIYMWLFCGRFSPGENPAAPAVR